MDLTPVGVSLALLIGVALGFFGGGGSILTVPLLVYVFGLAPKEAIASSLLIVAIVSVSSALQHARAGNLRLRTGLIFGGAGVVGAYIGGRAAAYIDGGVLLLLFASMMMITAFAMWRRRAKAVPPDEAGRNVTLRLVLQGTAVGAFTGLVGAGGGFMIVPALVLWAGLPIGAAVGTSLLVVVMNTLAAFLGYAAHLSVDYRLVSIVGGCGVVGSFAGTALSRVIPPEPLRKTFAVFVLTMASVILVREGVLVVQAAAEALPATLPQLFFAALMLGVGVYAGRISHAPGGSGLSDVSYESGDGI